MVDVVFYAGWLLVALYALYWVVRLAVRHGVMDANTRRRNVSSEQAESLRGPYGVTRPVLDPPGKAQL